MTDTLRILVLGDVVGEPGRKACTSLIPGLRETHGIDFVIANVENIAGGSGITEATTAELFKCGVDLMTSGDHAFRKKEALSLLDRTDRILRPANFPATVPGKGSTIQTIKGVRVGVINLLGRVFLKSVDCPFQAIQRELEHMADETDVLIVDFHAEATAEKMALAWFLDGKVSAVFGTHTHVQTADEQILPHGTAYITDIGMCGPFHSVIGREIDDALKMMMTQLPVRLEVASGDARVSGAMIDVDVKTAKALKIVRVHEKVESALHEVRS